MQPEQVTKVVYNPFAKNCTSCDLHERSKVNCMRGLGPNKPKVMFIEEAPSREDEIYAEPLSGEVGRLFNSLLNDVGLSRSDVYITNAIRCRPAPPPGQKKDLKPKKKNIEACRQYLIDEIKKVQPEIIVPLGNIALNLFMPKAKITEVRGREYDSKEFGCKIFPMMRPSAILRSVKYEGLVKQDFKFLGRLVSGNKQVEEKKTHVIIKDMKTWKHVKQRLLEVPAWAFDLETTGFNATDDDIISIGFSWKENTGVCLPLLKGEFAKDEKGNDVLVAAKMFWSSSEQADIWDDLRRIFKDSKAIKIAHNGSFDVKFLLNKGVDVPYLEFDTIVAHHLLDEEAEHGLKSLAWIYTNEGGYEGELAQFLKKKGDSYLNIPLDILAKYNIMDVDVTFQLYHIFKQKLDEQGLDWLFNNISMPLQNVLTRVSRHGVRVDIGHLGEMQTKYKIRIDEIVKEVALQIAPHYGQELTVTDYSPKSIKERKKCFNLNSSQQLGDLLFNKLNLPIIKKTDTNRPSTDDEVLTELAKLHPFPKIIAEYRTLNKLKSTYLDGIRKKVDESSRVHTDYRVYGTACITADSYLWSANGLKQVKDIIPSTSKGFSSFNIPLVNEHKRLEKTSHFFNAGKRKTIKIKTALGITIKGTKEHPLKVLRDGNEEWVALENIKKGDFIKTSLGASVWGKDTSLEHFNYEKKTNAKNIKQPSTLTPDLARLVGYWVAEGNNIKQENHGRYGIAITNTDPGILDDIYKIAEKSFNIEPQLDVHPRNKHVTTIKLISKELYYWWVLNFGEQSGAKNKYVPDIIKRTNFKNIKEFLKGYTTDACVGVYSHTKNKPIPLTRFVSDSRRLSLEVHQILLNAGYKAKWARIKKYKDRKKTHTGEYFAKYSYKVDLMDTECLKFVKDIGLVCEAHKDRLKNNLKKVVRIRQNKQSTYIKTYKDVTFVRVLDKVRGREEKVYDFTLPKTHSYTANGLVNHNTGRLASRDPNLQNIPRDKDMRNLFVASKGRKLIEADYSQHELRVVAAMAKDPDMLAIFNDGRDIHAEVGSSIFNVAPDKLTKEQRVVAKKVNFGIIYGIGGKSLAETLTIEGIKTSQWQGESYVQGFYRKFPKVQQFMQGVERQYRRELQLQNSFGRKRRFPKSLHNNPKQMQAMRNQALNFPVQCLHPDTKVLTTKGYISLANLKKLKRKPRLFTGFTFSKYRVVESGPKIEYRITNTLDEEITCSGDHRFMRISEEKGVEWIPTMDLKNGDQIVVLPPEVFEKAKLPCRTLSKWEGKMDHVGIKKIIRLGTKREMLDISVEGEYQAFVANGYLAHNSSASDIVSLATIEAEPLLNQFNANIVLTIHDAVVVDTPTEHVDSVAHILSKITEKHIPQLPGVPFKADILVGDRWGALVDYKDYKESMS
jgi:uracil-DNA glycosylase family 4